MADVNDPIVGIDLGTTNSVVTVADGDGGCRVLADEHGYKIQPAVVSFHPNGSVLVGGEAKQRRVIDPRNTVYSAKRLIGRSYRSREVTAAAARMPYTIKEGINEQPVIVTRAGEFAVPELSAIVLDHMRNLARRSLECEVGRAVVTVPASFTDAQRSATATAGAIAGLTVVRVLNEPTAAALAYGHNRSLDEVIAVYDFGGGTFDVTILRLKDSIFEVLGTAGDSFLGGDDLDERLVDHMVEVFLARERIDLRDNDLALQRLRQVAEQTKIQLSRRSRAVIKIDEIAYGPGGAPLDFQLEVSREEFVARVADIVERTFPVCQEALRVAGIGPAAIDDVVLVGGTTKMPLVRQRTAGFFGKPPRTDVNPDEAVAIGAGLQAVALQRILTGKARTTAKSQVAPPAPPMEARGPSVLPPIPPGRSTAPRFSTAEPTIPNDPPGAGDEGDFDAEHTTGVRNRDHFRNDPARPRRKPTLPQGFKVERTPPPSGERAARRGTHHDELPGARPAVPLARITKPASPPPPVPPVERPVPRSSPAARTLFGATTAPAQPPAQPLVSFKDLSTDIPTQVRHQEPITELDLPGGAGAGQPAAFDRPAAGSGLPVVLDVTPHSLGIGTVAGFCEELISRNARVPTQMSRVFATSKDLQQSVRIRVCQGESRRIDDNVVLGDLVLDGLEARPRGHTKIEVTFVIDESGILRVRARDSLTGREQRADLDLVGAQSPGEVAEARERIAQLRR